MKIKKPTLIILLLSFLLFICAKIFTSFYSIGYITTPSIKGDLFLIKKDIGDISKVKYLVFKYDSFPYATYTRGYKLIKYIGCHPGQNISYKRVKQEYYYFCDNNIISVAVKEDSKGNKLPHFEFNGTIPKDNYFVVGDFKSKSFDSSYWGFVKKNQIIGEGIKVW